MKSSPETKKRLLVFVVAYHAESTLTAVLERIPAALFETYDCEILVIDDASTDRTFAIGREYKRDHPEVALTVLRNELNQGYGGNQKIGYAYAIAEGFDAVALLHGDAQYAPEELPKLTAPIAAGHADAVFGSRMMVPGAAIKGGMPLYKYVGNRILTEAQNFVLGTRLSEFHSGYRIYSVSALKKVPFRLNSNDFHFDTEIIIQFLNAGARIVELPIPTYYGDEICRVNGMKYARDVMSATLRNAAHRAGVLYQRRFDTQVRETRYDLKLNYASSHTYAIDAVPPGSKVIDIGGGSGGVAKELVRKELRGLRRGRQPAGPPGAGGQLPDLRSGRNGPHGRRLLASVDARHHRAPGGAGGLSRPSAHAVHLRAEDARSDHAEHRLSGAAGAARARAVQLQPHGDPRLHPPSALHVPWVEPPAARLQGSR